MTGKTEPVNLSTNEIKMLFKLAGYWMNVWDSKVDCISRKLNEDAECCRRQLRLSTHVNSYVSTKSNVSNCQLEVFSDMIKQDVESAGMALKGYNEMEDILKKLKDQQLESKKEFSAMKEKYTELFKKKLTKLNSTKESVKKAKEHFKKQQNKMNGLNNNSNKAKTTSTQTDCQEEKTATINKSHLEQIQKTADAENEYKKCIKTANDEVDYLERIKNDVADEICRLLGKNDNILNEFDVLSAKLNPESQGSPSPDLIRKFTSNWTIEKFAFESHDDDDDDDDDEGGAVGTSKESLNKKSASKRFSLVDEKTFWPSSPNQANRRKSCDVSHTHGHIPAERGTNGSPTLMNKIARTLRFPKKSTGGRRTCHETKIVLLNMCIQFMNENGLDEEGIYRKAGQKQKTEAVLKELMDNDGDDFDEVLPKESIHAVASIIKMLIKMSSEFLFTDDVKEELFKIFETPINLESPSTLETIKSCLKRLPARNSAVLTIIFKHLKKVSLSSKANQMSASNLSLVLTPTITCSDNSLEATDETALETNKIWQGIIEYFINDCEALFDLQADGNLDTISDEFESTSDMPTDPHDEEGTEPSPTVWVDATDIFTPESLANDDESLKEDPGNRGEDDDQAET